MGASWPAPKNRSDHWVSYAVLDQNWKLVANEDLNYYELYDIVNDVYEKVDLKETNTDVVENLINKIMEWKNGLPEKPDKRLFSSER
jgi:N-acetylgalactosamine-6-sulfatase